MSVVLNCNDNEAARYTVSAMLRRGGFQVLEARSGLEALEMVEKLRPTVAILDVRLPDIDGFELTRRIRANPATAATKVLCTSATFVTLERKLEGLGAGADGYLIQPFEHQELIATVRSLLRLASAEQMLRDRATVLVEADRRKDEFLAMLAHELRNPLAAISASLPQFERRPASDDAEQRARDIVRRQVAHLTRLVDDLLDVSRVTQGKIELRLETVDLVGVLERVTAAIRERGIAPRNQSLRLTVPSSPVRVRGDVTRLEQIFANLVDNASKYTEPGGSIDVTLTPRDPATGLAAVHVKDNGIGISPAHLESIFGLFAQADVPIARSRGGLGIGLTLVRTLVELHGGRVEATSDGAGRGSAFHVRVPALDDAIEAPSSGDGAGAATVRPQTRRRIVIVEDNVDAQQALKDLCEFWGHTVHVASDGLAGVDVALRERPDVCLVDIGLPGIDGYEVARRVRSEAAGDNIFLVALTGYGAPEQRTQALDAGFDLHIVKPVEPAALEKMLDELSLPGSGEAHVHARVPVTARS